jgi:hypothetical protein
MIYSGSDSGTLSPRMLLKMRADLDELESPVWCGAGRLNICLIQLLLHHLEITAF